METEMSVRKVTSTMDMCVHRSTMSAFSSTKSGRTNASSDFDESTLTPTSNKPVMTKFWLLWVAVLFTTLVATGCLAYFVCSADWFYNPGPWAPDWHGYTFREWLGMMSFLFFAPVAFLLYLEALRGTLRRASGTFLTLGWLFAVLSFAFMLAVANAWAIEVSKCGGVFCTNTTKYFEIPYQKPDAGNGWKVQTSAGLVIATGMLIVFSFVQLTMTAIREPKLAAAERATPLAEGVEEANCKPYVESVRFSWVVYFLCLFVLFVMFWFVLIIPGGWQGWTAARIAKNVAEHKVVSTKEECAMWNRTNAICPEYPWAVWKTTVHKVSPTLYINNSPYNLMWYSWLALTPFGALLFKTFGLTRVFSWKVRLCLPKKMVAFLGQRYVSLGEVLITFAVLLIFSCWTLYWAQSRNYLEYWPNNYGAISRNQLLTRMTGQISVLPLSLLLLPTGRYSIMSIFFGSSWEASMKYHRRLGKFFAGVLVIHTSITWAWYSETESGIGNIYWVPLHLFNGRKDFTIPVVQWLYWMMWVTIGMCAFFEQVRRRNYELFLYAHHITYLTLIPAVIWHGGNAWAIMVPGMFIWFADRCLRFYRGSLKATVQSCTCRDYGGSGRVAHLVLSAPFDYYPGHYCFINAAEVSLLEWHPFTISSSSHGVVSFHIKDQGPGTFTGTLYAKLSEMGAGSTISLDGPIGQPVDFHEHENIVLVAGGIGITPCKSIFEHIRKAGSYEFPRMCRVHLIWTSRERGMFEIMTPVLQLAERGSGIEFVADFYSTQKMDKTDLSMVSDPHEKQQFCITPTIHAVRPDIHKIFKELHAINALVFACGPEPLVAQAEDAAHACGWEFHEETFAL